MTDDQFNANTDRVSSGASRQAREDLQQWVETLELPFSGIREAKRRIGSLQARRAELGVQAERLRLEFRKRCPRGTVAAYLCRDTDKTLTPLRWRASSKVGRKDARKRFELDSALGQRIFNDLPARVRTVFLNIEIRRIHLNQAIVTTMYELDRLRAFVQRYAVWRTLRNAEMAQHSRRTGEKGQTVRNRGVGSSNSSVSPQVP